MSRKEKKESSTHQEDADNGGIGYVKEEEKIENHAQNDDENYSDDFDTSGFIRIRSEDDDIFEHFNIDFDEDEDFSMKPEVETSSRKRKQIINVKGNGVDDVPQMLEIGDDSDDDFYYGSTSYTIDRDALSGGSHRNRIPLYRLNPDDYAHDLRRQIQIRRAIITYRHHQSKKEQIILLTDENEKLRAYAEALKGLTREVTNNCTCENNKNVDFDLLDVKIPVVPPRMYVSAGGKPVIASPFRRTSPSSTDSNGCGSSDGFTRESVTLERKSDATSIERPKEPIINLRNFRRTTVLGPTPVRSGSVAYTGPTRSGIFVPPPPIKKEPCILKVASRHVQTPTTSSPVVKVEEAGAASVPTASQLLFASRAKQNVGISSSSEPRVFQSTSDRVFKTASGLALQEVHVPASNRFSNPTFKSKRTRSDVLTPILPKHVEPKKVAMDDMWKKYDESDDDDELAMISASLGSPPLPTKSRKQGIVPRKEYCTGNKDGVEVDFGDKYKDVVFEEAE